MPYYLVVGCTILVCVAILLSIYMIFAFRKFHIVCKKIDYLVEDLTYKVESLSPTVDSIVKISNLIDILNSVLHDKSRTIMKYVSGNQETINKAAEEIKSIVSKKK